MRQECVLLRLVEAMHFIDEEQHWTAPGAPQLARLLDDELDITDAGGDGAEALELGTQGSREQPGERRLAASRRPPEEQRARHLAAVEKRPQRTVRSQEM